MQAMHQHGEPLTRSQLLLLTQLVVEPYDHTRRDAVDARLVIPIVQACTPLGLAPPDTLEPPYRCPAPDAGTPPRGRSDDRIALRDRPAPRLRSLSWLRRPGGRPHTPWRIPEPAQPTRPPPWACVWQGWGDGDRTTTPCGAATQDRRRRRLPADEENGRQNNARMRRCLAEYFACGARRASRGRRSPDRLRAEPFWERHARPKTPGGCP
jgi:hypothetical protein